MAWKNFHIFRKRALKSWPSSCLPALGREGSELARRAAVWGGAVMACGLSRRSLPQWLAGPGGVRVRSGNTRCGLSRFCLCLVLRSGNCPRSCRGFHGRRLPFGLARSHPRPCAAAPSSVPARHSPGRPAGCWGGHGRVWKEK